MWSFVLFIFICFVPHISVLFPSLPLGDGVEAKLLSYVGMFRIIFTLFIYNFPTSFFGRLTCFLPLWVVWEGDGLAHALFTVSVVPYNFRSVLEFIEL